MVASLWASPRPPSSTSSFPSIRLRRQRYQWCGVSEVAQCVDRQMPEIIQQYVEQARSDPYEAGNCSFCGERPVAAWFEGPSSRTFVRSSAEVRAEEAWLACAICLGLVEANDREGLVERGAERLRRRDRDEGRQRSPSEEAWMQQMTRDQQEKLFWVPRQG